MQIGRINYDPRELVVDNPNVLQGIFYLIESNSTYEFTDVAMWTFRKACIKHRVTSEEMIDSFWKAYADPYVSKGRIEFRHMWKHIEFEREKPPVPQYLTTRLG